MIKKSIKTYDFTTKPTLRFGDGTTVISSGGHRVTGYSTITSGNNNIIIGNNNTIAGQYLTTTDMGNTIWSTNNTNRITTFTGEVRYPGAIMYNSELNRLETWNGTIWTQINL